MKILIATILITLLPYFQQDEVYHIIKVEGVIYIASTGKQVKQGDKIKPTDELEFASADASALVISNTRGKFTLQMPENDDFFDDSKLFAMADNAISPISGRPQVSTRSTFGAEITDLETYLGAEDFNIIGNELELKLSKTKYPIDENNYFLLRYKIDESPIKRKPEVKDQSIVFNKTQLLEGTNADVNKIEAVEIFQVNKNSNETEYITSVNLIFLDKDALVKEFEIILEILTEQSASKNEISEYLRNYFTDIYGNTDMNSLYIFINNLTSGL